MSCFGEVLCGVGFSWAIGSMTVVQGKRVPWWAGGGRPMAPARWSHFWGNMSATHVMSKNVFHFVRTQTCTGASETLI